jgi:acyl dehydratase
LEHILTTFTSVEHLKQSKGADLGRSRTVGIPQSRIDAFADVTEDRQWIHIDPQRAAAGPFGSTIAHGFLTLSLAAPFLEDLLQVEGAAASINYGLNRVRFPSTVPADSQLHAQGRLIDIVDRPSAVDAVVELSIYADDSVKPACIAESIIRFIS